MILITTIKHAVASLAHELVVGAKATEAILVKVAAVVKADAPTIEALTALVDPRAAVIERIGVALIGELEPEIAKLAGDVSSLATSPSVALSAEIVAELKALYASLASEISAAKASVAGAPAA